MKFKTVLNVLSGGKSFSSKSRDASENSPMEPKRLLTPGLGPSGSSRRGQALVDVTASGTPRALNYGDTSPTKGSRLQRETSLSRPSPSGAPLSRQPSRLGSTPARTPARQPTRFAHQPHQQQQYVDAGAGSAIAAAASGALTDASDNIRVVLRVRPRSDKESTLGGGVVVQPVGSSTVRVASHPEPHTFSFDYVAGDSTNQETIFTVAYGQTGSGKTYTMLGATGEEGGDGLGGSSAARDESRGLIQRVFEHLFARIARGGGKYLLECSFLEIYNETITDLLDPLRTNLQVRENLEGQYVSNLTAHEVYRGELVAAAEVQVEDVVALLCIGQANRRVGETNMNERSSRSHSVFTCKLQSKTVDLYGTSHTRCSRLHLVDLAGSERQKASGAQGERLKEATAINKSLSALGNVIMSLVDQQHGRGRHIPYRDSRLTYLLQDSLGGNAKTCLVAAVSPGAFNCAETLSTLRFADQAKRIKNQAVVNEDTDGDKAALKHEIKRLTEELAVARRAQQQQSATAPATADQLSLSGTPARLAAAADALLGASTAAASPSGPGLEGARRRQALMGALRREDAAVKEVARLEAELEAMRGLLKAKESDLQRGQMMLKLKESRLARMQAGVPAIDAPIEVAELRREVELLRGKVESHPEVKRFAVENLHLSEEVKKLEGIVKRQELAALLADVGSLRSEMLLMEDELTQCKKEAQEASDAAEAARVAAEALAAGMLAQALAGAEAKAAEEACLLRDQLAKQQLLCQERGGQVEAVARDNEELQARVELLQATVEQLEGTHSDLRGQLSPAKRQVRQYEHDMGLLRQESQAAGVRASSEAMLRTQAELGAAALQARGAATEAECARLRAANQELLAAKSDAEEQLGSAASAGVELAALRVQLELGQAAAEERMAELADALDQLDSSRQQVAALEAEVQSWQREAAEAAAGLQRQQAEHQGSQEAAAARIAGALTAAAEMQRELDNRAARVHELQAASDAARAALEQQTQRCGQLADEKQRLARMLAQRDNELQEMEQCAEERDAEIEQIKAQAEKMAGEVAGAQAALAAKGTELEAAGRQVAGLQSQLEEVTGAMQDAHDQLTELQERLALVESQQAQQEYDLSDKSASLREATEQVGDLKRQLGEARTAQAAATTAAATAAMHLGDSKAAAAAAASQASAQLSAVKQAAAAEAKQAAKQLDASQHAAAVELAAAVAAASAAQGASAAVQSRLEEAEQQLAAAQAEAEQQRQAAGAAQQQARELEKQLQQLQQGTLIQKEQQLILGRAEVKELRQQLAEQEEVGEKLRAQLEARGADVSRLQQEMAAEVSEAAHQVQLLLAAQARVAALEAEASQARRQAEESKASQLPSRVAQAVAAARAAARTELESLEEQLSQRDGKLAALEQERDGLLAAAAAGAEAAAEASGADQAGDQVGALIAEREAWIEEVQAQRAEATAAVEASRALERRFGEVSEERGALAAALTEVQARAEKLEQELTHLTGQHNLNQRIQYHKKIKDENGQLREELGRLRIDQHRAQVRYERVAQELSKVREANGQEGLPDFEVEEALRDALAATEQQKQQLERELESVAQAVLALAGTGTSAAEPAAGAGAASGGGSNGGKGEERGDIVLEFGGGTSPTAQHHGASLNNGAAAAAGVRRALADISAAQAAAARGLEDQAHQIRLLKESSKLQRLRRASSVADRQA